MAAHVKMLTVLARLRLGHPQEVDRQARRGVQRDDIALGINVDRATE